MAGSDVVLNSAIVLGALGSSVVATAIGVRGAYAVAGVFMMGTAMLGHRLLAPVARSERVPDPAPRGFESPEPLSGSLPPLAAAGVARPSSA